MIGINTSPGEDDGIADDNLHHVAAHGFEPCELDGSKNLAESGPF